MNHSSTFGAISRRRGTTISLAPSDLPIMILGSIKPKLEFISSFLGVEGDDAPSVLDVFTQARKTIAYGDRSYTVSIFNAESQAEESISSYTSIGDPSSATAYSKHARQAVSHAHEMISATRGFIGVYNVTDEGTLHDMVRFHRYVQRVKGVIILPLLIVAFCNSDDSRSLARQVSQSHGRRYADSCDASYHELDIKANPSSALEAVHHLVHQLLRLEGKETPMPKQSSARFRHSVIDTEYIKFTQARTSDGVAEVRAATIPKLIQRLTYAKYEDPVFTNTFLMTFRPILSPMELLQHLVDRYNVQPPPGMVSEQRNAWKRTHQAPIRLRVMQVIKNWLMNQGYDFARDRELCHKMGAFLKSCAAESKTVTSSLQRMLDRASIASAEAADDAMTAAKDPSAMLLSAQIMRSLRSGGRGNSPRGSGGGGKGSGKRAPKSILSRKITKKGAVFGLADVDCRELARQMTLVDQHMFRAILPPELLNCAWSRKGADVAARNVLSSVRRFNAVCMWVATSIVAPEKLRTRARMMKKCIRLADQLRRMNNFNGFMAVMAGLQTTSVHRLKQTRAALPKKLQTLFSDLKRLVDPSSNCAMLRSFVQDCTGPLVPYMGPYLTDLTYIEDCNPDKLDGNLINFEKRRRLHDLIQELFGYKTPSYVYRPVQPLLEYLETPVYVEEEELYALSCNHEPRSGAVASRAHRRRKRAAKQRFNSGSRVVPKVAPADASRGGGGGRRQRRPRLPSTQGPPPPPPTSSESCESEPATPRSLPFSERQIHHRVDSPLPSPRRRGETALDLMIGYAGDRIRTRTPTISNAVAWGTKPVSPSKPAVATIPIKDQHGGDGGVGGGDGSGGGGKIASDASPPQVRREAQTPLQTTPQLVATSAPPRRSSVVKGLRKKDTSVAHSGSTTPPRSNHATSSSDDGKVPPGKHRARTATCVVMTNNMGLAPCEIVEPESESTSEGEDDEDATTHDVTQRQRQQQPPPPDPWTIPSPWQLNGDGAAQASAATTRARKMSKSKAQMRESELQIRGKDITKQALEMKWPLPRANPEEHVQVARWLEYLNKDRWVRYGAEAGSSSSSSSSSSRGNGKGETMIEEDSGGAIGWLSFRAAFVESSALETVLARCLGCSAARVGEDGALLSGWSTKDAGGPTGNETESAIGPPKKMWELLKAVLEKPLGEKMTAELLSVVRRLSSAVAMAPAQEETFATVLAAAIALFKKMPIGASLLTAMRSHYDALEDAAERMEQSEQKEGFHSIESNHEQLELAAHIVDITEELAQMTKLARKGQNERFEALEAALVEKELDALDQWVRRWSHNRGGVDAIHTTTTTTTTTTTKEEEELACAVNDAVKVISRCLSATARADEKAYERSIQLACEDYWGAIGLYLNKIWVHMGLLDVRAKKLQKMEAQGLSHLGLDTLKGHITSSMKETDKEVGTMVDAVDTIEALANEFEKQCCADTTKPFAEERDGKLEDEESTKRTIWPRWPGMSERNVKELFMQNMIYERILQIRRIQSEYEQRRERKE